MQYYDHHIILQVTGSTAGQPCKTGAPVSEKEREKQKGATSEEVAPGFRKCGKKNGVP
ncbi:hypothetical protein DP090_015605 [Pseudomonas sp. MDMC216]|nr:MULTISPECIES: hypothetical protein [unclassified Pseudomonas]MDI5994438.1 hypothetical protein [Pseudomonas sp. MDMC216]MDI6009595.1 hypothetical protein [Pseudomonas sp. MDMC17]